MTIAIVRPAVAKLGAHIANLALMAVALSALSACSAANDSMPRISASEMTSGQTIPEGILPNGIVSDPYHG
jgi:hypothetical protein